MLASFLLVVSNLGLAIISTLFSCSNAESSKSSTREFMLAICSTADAPPETGKFTLRFCVEVIPFPSSFPPKR